MLNREKHPWVLSFPGHSTRYFSNETIAALTWMRCDACYHRPPRSNNEVRRPNYKEILAAATLRGPEGILYKGYEIRRFVDVAEPWFPPPPPEEMLTHADCVITARPLALPTCCGPSL